MAFISDSVGQSGKNQFADVKIIQWMLIKAQSYYGINLFSKTYSLAETGNADTDTGAAIADVVKYGNKLLTEILFTPNVPAILGALPTLYNILPDDRNYQFLLRCSIKPLCTNASGVKIDFQDDPIARQALGGKINFATFKKIIETKDGLTGCETLTSDGLKAKEFSKDARVRAFLDMLAWAEGFKANRPPGYDEASNWVKMDDLADHPNRTLKGGGSSAAGRYQFMTKDWNDTKKTLGLTDFTPDSQDIGATYLLQSRPSLKNNILDALLADDFNTAVQRASNVWASLPDKNKSKNGDVDNFPASHYPNQPAASRKVLREKYDAALKNY